MVLQPPYAETVDVVDFTLQTHQMQYIMKHESEILGSNKFTISKDEKLFCTEMFGPDLQVV